MYSFLNDLFLTSFRISNAYHVKIRSDPTPGQTLELGFLGTVLQVEIPHSLDVQQVTETSSFNEKYDPRAHVRTNSACGLNYQP